MKEKKGDSFFLEKRQTRTNIFHKLYEPLVDEMHYLTIHNKYHEYH